MFYIHDKKHNTFYCKDRSLWMDFDQLSMIKPYKQWITAVEKMHKLGRGELIGADQLISILLDKHDVVQRLKGGMQEKRACIAEKEERITQLTQANMDLIRMMKEMDQTSVSSGSETVEAGLGDTPDEVTPATIPSERS